MTNFAISESASKHLLQLQSLLLGEQSRASGSVLARDGWGEQDISAEVARPGWTEQDISAQIVLPGWTEQDVSN
ncbi:hypothetical protein [Pseudomonas mucidolens]|uniref:hypothetical protein n=1 Tax=Pseudomonas mucidolens TaxID=46679 RepID=UPI0030DCBBA5